MKILYVTTRQWNPGDEFILRGSRRILQACGIKEDVASIYNKSPQTTSLFESWNFWKKPYYKSLASSLDFAVNITHYDNSFKRSNDINFYDIVVFSGSPAWYGGRLKPLYKKLKEFRGKILFLGIGTPNKPLALSEDEKNILRRSTVFCRNQDLVKNLGKQDVVARYLPCPALMSSPFERDAVNGVNLVGLGFNVMDTHRYQRMSSEKFALQKRLFEALNSRYDCRIICHYVDELEHAAELYGTDKVRYAFDAIDYPGLYSEFDFVLSSRVHGCGMASSVGVPNAAITHDARGDTVNGFLSARVDSEVSLSKVIDQRVEDLIAWQERIKSQKKSTLVQYVEALSPVLSF
jgi:hypothetical protein